MERKVPDLRVGEIGFPLAPAGHRRVHDRETGYGVAIRAGQRECDHGPDVMPAPGVTLEAERHHNTVDVRGKARPGGPATGA